MNLSTIEPSPDAPLEQPKAPRSFRGWWVVSGSFISQALSAGLCFNAFGVFVLPLAESFESTVGTISTGLTIGMVVMALIGPMIGRAADRGYVRLVMVAGVALLGLGLHMAALSAVLWQAGLAFCLLVCVGSAMTGQIPTMAVVGNWFDRRRGIALGITVAGATVASMGAPALGEWLIAEQGWRGALQSMGTFALLLGVPAVAWLIIGRPSDVEQLPDGEESGREAVAEASPEPVPVSLRDRNVWLVSMAFGFLFASPIVISVHLPGYLTELGIGGVGGVAAYFLALGPASILSKLIFGAVADRVDLRHALYAAIAVLGLSWVFVLFTPLEGWLWLGGALFGFGVGATGPLQGFVAAACFGRGAVGRVMGYMGLLGLPLVAASPALVGILFDFQGDYETGFYLMAATLIVSAVLFALVRIPEVEPGTSRPVPASSINEA
jgi:MFS family permease